MSRIVVKVGTHAIASRSGHPDHEALSRLVKQICKLKKAGNELIFVSSGAVAAGMEALGLTKRPDDINDIQMCAAVGQARFICEYEMLFEEFGEKIGQVLLTYHDIDAPVNRLNVQKSLEHLVKAGIIPIINENDVVADDEIKGMAFGDNDWLSFLIAQLVGADALVLLSTVDGLLDENGKRIDVVKDVSKVMRLAKKKSSSSLSKGGMLSKLKAIKASVDAGIDTYIANGRKQVLSSLFNSRRFGTFFPGQKVRKVK